MDTKVLFLLSIYFYQTNLLYVSVGDTWRLYIKFTQMSIGQVAIYFLIVKKKSKEKPQDTINN